MPDLLPDLRPYLDPMRVHRQAGLVQRDESLARLAALVARDWDGERRATFLDSLIAREDVATTALGRGFAIPHARTLHLMNCRIAVGLYADGIDWPAADRQPVRVVALLASRESDHQEHLRLMASLAASLRQGELLDRLIATADAVQAVTLLGTPR